MSNSSIMKFICALFSIMLFFSCEEDPLIKDCSDNPLENIDWLKSLVDTENNTDMENSNGLEITQYTYEKQTAFLINNCINCSDNLTILYDCDQNKLCEFGGIVGVNTCPDFEQEASDKKILFTTRQTKDCSDNPLENIVWLKDLVELQ